MHTRTWGAVLSTSSPFIHTWLTVHTTTSVSADSVRDVEWNVRGSRILLLNKYTPEIACIILVMVYQHFCVGCFQKCSGPIFCTSECIMHVLIRLISVN